MSEINEFLEIEYQKAVEDLSSSEIIVQSLASKEIEEKLNFILNKSEDAKGVLTVIVTSIVYKHFNKEQDICYHQANMSGGYSGRSFDAANITPFLKSKNFPAMAESGWLTRSLEQNRPYIKIIPAV